MAFAILAAGSSASESGLAGIVDPVKVVRSALQNAASIANMVLFTEVVIVEKPEKKSGMPAGGEDYDY